MMTKRLAKIGTSYGVVIDKPILALLGIDPESEVDISTDGQKLIIEPHRKMDRDKARAAGHAVMQAHRSTLDKLAK